MTLGQSNYCRRMEKLLYYKVKLFALQMLMGDVPDRGGRPGEIEPPMPSFTSRRDGSNQYKKKRPGSSGKKKNKQS